MPPTQSNVTIRPRQPRHDETIATLVTAAFGTDAEAKLIEALRRDGDSICEFVAVAGGALVGHILFSRLDVSAGSEVIHAAALAPLAVAPDHQRQGIGDALTRRGLVQLRDEGYELVVVLGDPNYYARFGFSALLAKLLDAPYSGDAFMALELKPGVLAAIRWNVTYPKAFAGPH